MQKDFRTYNSQMRYLRDIKNIQCSGGIAKRILCRTGYFNLINGYKTPFTNGKIGDQHTYIPGTSISHIKVLKEFDDNLRHHLFKAITKVEEEVRALAGYKFDQVNNNGKTHWYKVEAYDTTLDCQKIVEVIASIFFQLKKSKNNYIKHYLDNYNNIPTWIMIKTISFSTFIYFLEYGKKEVRKALCELYGIKSVNGLVNTKWLLSSLHMLRKVRNSCAHNERVYDYFRAGKRVYMPLFSQFGMRYKRDRNQKLFDLFIYLRYYMPNDEYREFLDGIKSQLLRLQQELNPIVYNKVRADIGVKNLSDLDLLIATNKSINYNAY